MTSILALMRDARRLCDDRLVAVEEMAGAGAGGWAATAAAAECLVGAVEQHLAREESVLFPAFEQATGLRDGPTAVMRGEHDQMRALLVELRRAVEASDAAQVLGVTETLMVLTQQHNMKEEQVLYPMADEALAGDGSLIDRLRAGD